MRMNRTGLSTPQGAASALNAKRRTRSDLQSRSCVTSRTNGTPQRHIGRSHSMENPNSQRGHACPSRGRTRTADASANHAPSQSRLTRPATSSSSAAAAILGTVHAWSGPVPGPVPGPRIAPLARKSSSSSSPPRPILRIASRSPSASREIARASDRVCAEARGRAALSRSSTPGCARRFVRGEASSAAAAHPPAASTRLRAARSISQTSSALVTSAAQPSRIARWQPALHGLSIEPGMQPASRERSSTARRAVSSAPDLFAASTTIVTNARPAMMRFRRGKRSGRGPTKVGCSVRTAPPPSTIDPKSGACSLG